MDLGFTRLDPAHAEVAPVQLDYLRLVATLSAMQAASRTAAVETNLRAGTFADAHPVLALVELLTAGPGWVGAVGILHGSFHVETALRSREERNDVGSPIRLPRRVSLPSTQRD